MDKIRKFLRKLSPKDRRMVEGLVELILLRDTESLDVKKLKGYADIYRVRKGKIRIMYQQTDSGVRLISIDNRDENTYRDF